MFKYALTSSGVRVGMLQEPAQRAVIETEPNLALHSAFAAKQTTCAQQ